MIRERQHLAAVKPQQKGLMLELMHFPDELRDVSDFKAPADRNTGKAEMKMARQLIESMTDDWDPTQYKDEYHDALEKLIEEKIEHPDKKIHAPTKKKHPTKVIDLVSVPAGEPSTVKRQSQGQFEEDARCRAQDQESSQTRQGSLTKIPAITMSRQSSQLTIGNKKLSVSNLDKVLYPQAGFTKGQMIDYYIHVSEVLLPHLKDRPLTLKRYPNGVDQAFFYEKESPRPSPRLGENRQGVERVEREANPLHLGERCGDAGLGGQPREH